MKRARLVLAVGLGWCVAVAAAEAPPLPPSEEMASTRLEESPRHAEYVTVDVAGGPVYAWVVYPERKDKAPLVIVIHEILGLTPWIRAVADQLAADGFIAIAADLLSGKAPGGRGTDAYAGRDEVTKAVSGLDRAEVMARLNAIRAYGIGLPAASGRSGAVGFCWGGSTSFAYAAAQPALDAAVVYYGTAPDAAALAGIKAPVLGLYGGDDARVDATIDATRARMAELGRTYDVHVFEGAGHGFLRVQGGKDGANRKAADAAWPLMLTFLRKYLAPR